MDRKQVDSNVIYAYREGRYGSPSPVRVFDALQAYTGSRERGFKPVAPSERRHPYKGSIRGGYLLARVRFGHSDAAALKSLESVTLDGILAGELPEDVTIELVRDLRNLWSEEWAHYLVRHAAEVEAKAAADKAKEDAKVRNEAIGRDLIEALERAGWEFGYGTGDARVNFSQYDVTLHMTPDQAQQLTRLAAVAAAGLNGEEQN